MHELLSLGVKTGHTLKKKLPQNYVRCLGVHICKTEGQFWALMITRTGLSQCNLHLNLPDKVCFSGSVRMIVVKGTGLFTC